MSWQPCDDPKPGDKLACDAIEMVIVPRARDLGGFEVRRALPSARRQMVGPFIFWDQMGPAEFFLGQGMDVRPHPHIGLATVTYLFDGEVIHRDSLGTQIPIRPGAMNLMSAGRGIVHSERTGLDARAVGAKLYGIQAWVALPRSHEEGEPTFTHYGEDQLPVLGDHGVRLRLIAGEALGARSPVSTPMSMIYADAQLEAGASVPFDPSLRGARPTRSRAWSRSRATASGRASFWCSGPATGSRCARSSRPASCFWAAIPWMGRAISGGTSCPRGPSGSSRRKPTGRPRGSTACRARPNSFHCRSRTHHRCDTPEGTRHPGST